MRRGQGGLPPNARKGTNQEKKKMDIIAAFATDEKLETEGKWFPLSKTAKILVARSGNEKFVTLLREQMKEAQLDLSSGDEAEKLAEEVLIDVMSRTVLVGWEGLTDSAGKPVPYTHDQARTYLRVKDFRRKVSALSENFEAYRAKAEAEQGKD